MPGSVKSLSIVVICGTCAVFLAWLSENVLGGELDCRRYHYRDGICARGNILIVKDLIGYAAIMIGLFTAALPAILFRRRKFE